MNAAAFETRYREHPDPWGYRAREYERAKYLATLDACGPGPFRAALELGGSIGIFSALLAPRCETLTTLDFAPTAVREARRTLRSHPQAHAQLAEIPAGIPEGPFDLVVAGEVLYYLSADALEHTIDRLGDVMSRRLVIVHWRPPGPERPLTAVGVHARIRALPWLRTVEERSTGDYLLHALERA